MSETTRVPIPADLTGLLHAARRVTILTGAGVSAESGVPTFRDSQTGLWSKYKPQELATPQAFAQNPALVLEWYRWRHDLVSQAQPNPGHVSLAAMESRFPEFTLITQNVDGLHARAGTKNLVELHGSLQRMRCSNADCGYSSGWPEEALPRCPECGELLRPDVIWFGEMLNPGALEKALRASQNCDIFFSIGTSGVVEPAASLPYQALRAGAVVIEINPLPTPLNIYAKFYFPHPAGLVLPQIVEAAWEDSKA